MTLHDLRTEEGILDARHKVSSVDRQWLYAKTQRDDDVQQWEFIAPDMAADLLKKYDDTLARAEGEYYLKGCVVTHKWWPEGGRQEVQDKYTINWAKMTQQNQGSRRTRKIKMVAVTPNQPPGDPMIMAEHC